MKEIPFDQAKIRQLEAALLGYVERYGLTESAKEALSQIQVIQGSSTPDHPHSQVSRTRVLRSKVVSIFGKYT